MDWHELVSDTDFACLDFKAAMARAQKDDVVYCDPPYTHSQGILYGAQDFKIEDLWDEIFKAKNRGVKVLVSINGKRESNHKDISVTPPDGLFERIIDVNVGKSMVDRLQKGGKKMVGSEVTDRLMMTY